VAIPPLLIVRLAGVAEIVKSPGRLGVVMTSVTLTLWVTG